jgi:ribonuclease VapC
MVIDSSAFLAFLQREEGANSVRPLLRHSFVSTVNWSEVMEKSFRRGVNLERLLSYSLSYKLLILPFTEEDAVTAAQLWEHTRLYGLSFGDRACLALAKRLGVPVLTADRAWQKLKVGVTVRPIR